MLDPANPPATQSPRRPIAAVLATAATLIASTLSAQRVVLELHGDLNGDEFGSSVACAGDVDADGIDDFIVGSRRDEFGEPESGAVFVHSGIDGSLLHEIGGGFASFFGWVVDGVGDIDGDGHADFAVGSPSSDAGGRSSGLVTLFSGATGAELLLIPGTAANERSGIDLAGIGDINQDGVPDIAVGAPFASNAGGPSAGAVRAYSGRDGSLLFEVTGNAPNELFGYSLAAAGDTNGDLCPDIVAGAIRATGPAGPDAGAARILSGVDGSLLQEIFGSNPGARFGISVDGGYDADGDSRADIIVGADLDAAVGPRSGSATLISGATGTTIDYFFNDASIDRFGASVAFAGDMTGDRRAEILIGAVQDERFFEPVGSVTIYDGRNGQPLNTIFGLRRGGQFGWSIAGAGDTDGDGFGEFIVGAITDDNMGSATLFDLDRVGSPPLTNIFGVPCDGGTPRSPRIDIASGPRIGSTARITLRGAPPGAPVNMFVGDPIRFVLAPISLPDCTLYIDPYITIPGMADAAGRAQQDFLLPFDLATVGNSFNCQWIVTDPSANTALPLVFSDTVSMIIGR